MFSKSKEAELIAQEMRSLAERIGGPSAEQLNHAAQDGLW
jgi:hypothetical protein